MGKKQTIGSIVEKFFDEYIAGKWQPMQISGLPAMQPDREKFALNAAHEIGTRYVGSHFTIDEINKQAYTDVILYMAGMRGGNLDVSKGLFIWGKVGCGKTVLMRIAGTFAHIFAKTNGHRMAACTDISNKYSLKGVDALVEYEAGTICFDDLGNEPPAANHYGSVIPVLPTVLQQRYNLWQTGGRWTHYTSNFDLAWIAENYGNREADRLREQCNVVKLGGTSRRK